MYQGVKNIYHALTILYPGVPLGGSMPMTPLSFFFFFFFQVRSKIHHGQRQAFQPVNSVRLLLTKQPPGDCLGAGQLNTQGHL